jgi:hypothetical protein
LLNAAGVLAADPRDIPMLCLGGGLDQSVFHRAGQDGTVADLLGADFDIIAGASHCLMLDAHWRESAEAILGWMRRVGAIAGP